ncbi:MAG: HIT domain-containing protein [Candidatus Margulisbacteria bacterium]|nr:HIT domain-containing protein [Candidatus Margulisiibacteriota bacterium]
MSDCIFCKIASKTIKSDIVYEDDKTLIFSDINPVAEHHYLVITKEHFSDILALPESEIKYIHKAIKIVVEKFGLAKNGFRIVNNCGPDAGQAVPHVHFHVIAGRKLSWPPG